MQLKSTISYCPDCLDIIPASIIAEDGKIYIKKQCKEHGHYEYLIEKDPNFYFTINLLPKFSGEPELLIDVTNDCNIKCNFCYHSYRSKISKAKIYELIKTSPFRVIVLTRGEPTVDDELFKIIQAIKAIGKLAILLTNGIKLNDKDYAKELLRTGIDRICISIHSNKEPERILENLLAQNAQKHHSLFFSFSDLEEIPDFIKLSLKYKKLIDQIRIRPIVDMLTPRDEDCIFLSDLFRYMNTHYKLKFLAATDNNLHHINVSHEGLFMRLISWPNIYNVDLQELWCPPYYYLPEKDKIYNAAQTVIMANHIYNYEKLKGV